MVENRRAVLRAHVAALTVQCRRIVNREEHVQQLVERYDGGIEADLHDLGVTGGAGAHVLVRRVGHMAPRVAGLDLLDALQLLERGFEAPEAAAGERGDFVTRHGTNLPRDPERYRIDSALRTPSPRGNGTRDRPGDPRAPCRRSGRRSRNPSRRRATASRGATPPLRS